MSVCNLKYFEVIHMIIIIIIIICVICNLPKSNTCKEIELFLRYC